LQECAHVALKLATQRRHVYGIDLTPAYFHALQLSSRIGAEAKDPEAVRRYEQLVRDSARLAIGRWERGENARGGPRQQALIERALAEAKRGRLKTLTISLMLNEGLVTDPNNGKPMTWKPPRMIMRSPGRGSARRGGIRR
jgi:hypothetical protein